jgi:molybdopterin/thiamine biosynthesis adenylyltransferase
MSYGWQAIFCLSKHCFTLHDDAVDGLSQQVILLSCPVMKKEAGSGIHKDWRFERSMRLFGAAAMQKLAESHVAVFGLGGVGGYAVEGLARVGVGHLTVEDFDRV